MKRRAAEPSTKTEENGEGTRPKGSEQEPEEAEENEPRKRTERGKEVGSRSGRKKATGGRGGSKPEETKESGGRERQSGSHCEAEA